MTADTVKDLLLRAYSTPISPLAHVTFVCELPEKGLENYLLRVGGVHPWTLFPSRLEQTSALVPVQSVGRNFGQAVLDSRKDFQIVLKKPGQSLWDLFYARLRSAESDTGGDRQRASLSAYKEVLKTLDALPMESFRRFADDINYLSEQGMKADFLAPNIFLHEGNLGLIDVQNGGHAGENNLDTLRKQWLDFKGYFGPRDLAAASDKDVFSLQRRVDEKMRRAAQAENMPFTSDAARNALRAGNRVFHGPVACAQIAAIPLSSTTRQLRLTLDEIEARSGIAR